MADQDTWNEDSTLIVNAAFKDEDGNPVAPTSAEYRLQDADDDDIVPWTPLALSPGATDVDIEITPAQMQIVDDRHTFEMRRLTVRFEWDPSRRNYGEYHFKLHNLEAAP